MNNKFKILDQLIEQVMAERNYSMDDLYTGDVNGASPKSSYDILRRISDPQEELTDEDFDYLINNIEAFNTDIQKKMVAIQKSKDASPELKAKVKSVFQKLQKASDEKLTQRQTITQPQIRTAAAEVAGSFPDELNTIMTTIFGSEKNFSKKIKHTSDISRVYFQAASGDEGAIKAIREKDNRDFLAEVMLLEYFAEIANSFDAGAGAYLFEYFLAMLGGGKVTGKETGPGGGMGAVDFTTEGGGAGSAKFYSKGSGVSQAASGFNIGQPVDYIVALKKQGAEQVGTKSRGTSDPARLMAADIYFLQVTKINEDEFEIVDASGKKYKKQDPKKIAADKAKAAEERAAKKAKQKTAPEKAAMIAEAKSKGPSLDLNTYLKPSAILGTIFIAETRTKTFRDMIYKSIATSGNKIKQTITQLVEDFFKSLDVAGASAKKYAVKGRPDDGSNTLEALNNADYNFNNLKTELEGDTAPSDEQIQENKLSALDKLIEAVILEEYKKGNQ